MTLQKSINTLSAMKEEYPGDEFPNEETALQIGIEAIEAILIWRDDGEGDDLTRLFSETFD